MVHKFYVKLIFLCKGGMLLAQLNTVFWCVKFQNSKTPIITNGDTIISNPDYVVNIW